MDLSPCNTPLIPPQSFSHVLHGSVRADLDHGFFFLIPSGINSSLLSKMSERTVINFTLKSRMLSHIGTGNESKRYSVQSLISFSIIPI